MSDLTNDWSYDYGLPLEKQFTQTNKTDIRILSVCGNYEHEEIAMEDDHTSSGQLSHKPQVNPGIKCENKSETEDIGNEVRGEIFREIETSDPKNIALMTSNLTSNPGNYVVPREI